MKRNLLLILITAVICISGTVLAENLISADKVAYSDTTVENALNNLYTEIDSKKLNNSVQQVYNNQSSGSKSYTLEDDYKMIILVAESSQTNPMYINGEAQSILYSRATYNTIFSYAFNVKKDDIITYTTGCTIYGIN